MRYAILTRRPACDTDTLSIYTQSGSLLATRHPQDDAGADAILVRYAVDATRATVSK
jgi:hypothetical protein